MITVQLLLILGMLFGACVVFILGVRCLVVREDTERYYMRLSAAWSFTRFVMWVGLIGAVLSAIGDVSQSVMFDPSITVPALMLFLLDLRLESATGKVRALLMMQRIDKGTYVPGSLCW